MRRKGTNPRQPNTEGQAFTRQIFSYISGAYYELPNALKVGWNYYASKISESMVGFNAFVQLNQQSLGANYITLGRVYTAPGLPNTPAAASGFVMTYNDPLDSWKVTWATPLSYSYFVQVYGSAMTGYQDSLFPAWSLRGTFCSALGYAYIDASPYATTTRLRSRLRVINAVGEISGYTETLTVEKT